ncbi:MAG: multidrug effflux MFS transporter [Anderseniella sp.]|jgi:DHA1 family bicyclomycin/chloramphenicol resistance-like MFS transporter|nr:multidrug effflux MFS transporter [Anderseniella sp.]
MSSETADTGSAAATAVPRAPFAILIAMAAIGPLALNIFIPSMPGLQQGFASSPGVVQLTLTVYLAGLALCQLLYGPLSDRYGRRPMLIAGMALFVAASIACALATSIEMLIAARGVQAIGGAAGMILSRAIVRDMYSREKSASVLGYITMAWVVAPMAAPAIGGILDQHFTFRASFWLLAVIGAMVLAGAVASLPETNLRLQPDASLIRTKLYAQLLRNRAFRGYTATISFGAAVFFLYLAVAPFIIITVRGHSPVEYGMWTIVAALGYMAGNFASGRYSEAIGNDRMIGYGNWLTLAGAAAMLGFAVAGFTHPASLFVPMAVCAFGNGLTIPNGLTAAISVDPRNIGSGAGLAGFVQMTIGALASQAAGYAQGTWHNTGFWAMAVFALLAAAAHPARRTGHQQ